MIIRAWKLAWLDPHAMDLGRLSLEVISPSESIGNPWDLESVLTSEKPAGITLLYV